MAKMADLSSVVQAITDLVVRIERLNDQSEIGSVVLRLDYITRMLVNLDVADELVNTMSCLRETVLAIEADCSSTVGQGCQAQLNRTGRRGRPSFDITWFSFPTCNSELIKVNKLIRITLKTSLHCI